MVKLPAILNLSSCENASDLYKELRKAVALIGRENEDSIFGLGRVGRWYGLTWVKLLVMAIFSLCAEET